MQRPLDCLTLLTEQFPGIDFNTHLYTIDRDRLTSSGGTVPLHMMLAMLAGVTRNHW